MTQTLLAPPHDQLAELLAASAGRFGRQLPTIAWPDPDHAPARSAKVLRMRARMTSGYQVDPLLVANAIVDRVCAGGSTTLLH